MEFNTDLLRARMPKRTTFLPIGLLVGIAYFSVLAFFPSGLVAQDVMIGAIYRYILQELLTSGNNATASETNRYFVCRRSTGAKYSEIRPPCQKTYSQIAAWR